jgi:conjugal transfer mating pair stabilization protein TraG
MSTLKGTDPATDALLDFIAVHESGGNYNAVIGNARSSGDLSVLTITAIYSLQSTLLAKGRPSTAVGRYQIIRDTLRGLVASERLDASEHFTPELQDRLAVALLVHRGYSDWWRGDMDDAAFAHQLSLEWASLPDPENDGKSHYDGIGPNHAGYSLSEVYSALDRVRSLMRPETPPEPRPGPVAPSIDPALVAEAIDVLGRLQAALAAHQRVA